MGAVATPIFCMVNRSGIEKRYIWGKAERVKGYNPVAMVLQFKLGGLTIDDYDTLRRMERDMERRIKWLLKDHKDFTDDSIVIADARINAYCGLLKQAKNGKNVRLSVFLNPKAKKKDFVGDVMPMIDSFADDVDKVVESVCDYLELNLLKRC